MRFRQEKENRPGRRAVLFILIFGILEASTIKFDFLLI
jgi:hypothetical protein